MTLKRTINGELLKFRFFEDFPFLDDPDNSDEQVMHGVEQRMHGMIVMSTTREAD
jgi:hypothetical protein